MTDEPDAQPPPVGLRHTLTLTVTIDHDGDRQSVLALVADGGLVRLSSLLGATIIGATADAMKREMNSHPALAGQDHGLLHVTYDCTIADAPLTAEQMEATKVQSAMDRAATAPSTTTPQ